MLILYKHFELFISVCSASYGFFVFFFLMYIEWDIFHIYVLFLLRYTYERLLFIY